MPNFENNSVSGDRQGMLAMRSPFPLDIDIEVRNFIGSVIHQSSKSKEQIAAEMSTLLGQPITASMLSDFAARSKTHRFPVLFVPAFCKVTGTADMIALQLKALGMRMPEPGDAELLDYARAALAKEKAQEQIDRARARMQEETR